MTLDVSHNSPVSGLEWMVLRGGREEVMRALGAHHGELIAAQRRLPDGEWNANVRRCRAGARERVAAVTASTRRRLPVESAELAWIAEGAEVDEFELWAQNLRGDLGRDGTGCTDLSFATEGGVVFGHNEDGDGEWRGRVRLVTLIIESDPALTALWYPGMLPANAFVTTAAGLSFGMDHVPVRVAFLAGCGRHFVARHAQRQANGADARAVLTGIPCAGGFAFDVADAREARIDLIENAGGHHAEESSPRGRRVRHTNHLRIIDDAAPELAISADDEWLGESRTRMAALEGVSSSATDADGVLRALRADGVRNEREDLSTLTTTVVDTDADEVIIQGAGEAWRGRWSAFASGVKVDV